MTNTLAPCFVCGKELENVWEGAGGNNQPYDANLFTSQGHYGSTMFDPMDGTFLEINICTECLKRGAEKSRLLHGRIVKPEVTQAQVEYHLYKEQADELQAQEE